jgi:hypothetical protein
MLRRAIPSFIVEVRGRPRLTTTSNPDVQSSGSKPPQAAFDRASDGAAAAAFGAKMDRSPVDVAPSHPGGRILPSLVPDEPRPRLPEDAPVPAIDSERPSRAPKRPSVRARKRGDQASKSSRNSRFSSEEHAPSAERPSTISQRPSGMQSDDGAGATTRAPSQVVGDRFTLSANSRKRISWPATFSAMKTNPARVGSGDCSGRDEAGLCTAFLVVDPHPSRRSQRQR